MGVRLLRTLLLTLVVAPWSAAAQQPGRQPDFDRMVQQQADTDKNWRAAADGHFQADKITYRSSAGDMDIPAWVFQPLAIRGICSAIL